MVVLLLAAKAEVIHADDDDLIALCAASEDGYQHVVVLLLAAKAEVIHAVDDDLIALCAELRTAIRMWSFCCWLQRTR